MAEGNCSALSAGELSTSGNCCPAPSHSSLRAPQLCQHTGNLLKGTWGRAHILCSSQSFGVLANVLAHASHETPLNTQPEKYKPSHKCRMQARILTHLGSATNSSLRVRHSCHSSQTVRCYTRQRTPQPHESGDMIMSRVLQHTLAQPIYATSWRTHTQSPQLSSKPATPHREPSCSINVLWHVSPCYG